MSYQTVGNLRLDFEGQENYTNYYRELDIQKAVSTTTFSSNGVTYRREVFTSFPDQAVIIRLTASKSNSISFKASLDRPSEVSISTIGNNILKMDGVTSDHETVKGEVKFQSLVKIVPEGGKIISNNKSLLVSGANSVTIFVSIASNFINYKDISANAGERASNYLAKASNKNYKQLLTNHIAYYQKFFNRVSLNL